MHLSPLHWLAASLCCATAVLAHGTGQDFEDHVRASAMRTIRVTTDENGKVNPWSHLDFHNDPTAFQFAIVADRTGGARPGVFEDAVHKLNLLQPEFVMSVGDLIEGYSQDPQQVNTQWNEFQGFIRKLEMPFFYVPGNHDQSNPTMAGIWRERFGRSYYSFIYRDVLFLCLNSQEPSMHHISDAEMQWARDTLAAHPDVRWTLVFLHTPLWEYADSADRGWPEIETALQGRDYTVFAGHFHQYLRRERNDARYYILATTGGGSSLRGPAYGEFDQVAWVTMTSNGPVVANLLLDGIQPDDIRTAESKSMVDDLIASVFSTDILWLPDTDSSVHTVAVQSANPTDVPVDVTFRLSAREGMSARFTQGFAATPDGRHIFTLQPKSSRALELQLQGRLPPLAHQAQLAAKLDWEARLQPAGSSRPLHIEESLVVPIVPRLKLPVIAQPATIDGDATEWTSVPLYAVTDTPFLRSTREGWTGAEDCNFRLGFAHDADWLYLVVEVRDDQIISQAALAPWKQDGIEVRIDFRPPAKQRAAHVGDGGLLFIGSSPAPGDGLDSAYVLNPASLPSGTKLCNRRTAEGCIFEAAIPLQALIGKYGEQWTTEGLRLNVAVNDRDEDGKQAQLWWQADWRTRSNIPGSGTLFFE